MPLVIPFIIYLSLALIISLSSNLKFNKLLSVFGALFALVNTLLLQPDKTLTFVFSGFDIVLFQTDKLSLFFGYIFSFIVVLIFIFTLNVKDNKHFVYTAIYVGSAVGIIFSGDFLTFYLFWEIMMVAAVVLIALNRNSFALKSAFKYLIMHLAGGGILLAGILLNYYYTGNMDIRALESGMPATLILVGIGLNAAFLPLHTWLPDAYSKSPISSALVLTVLTTKVAIFSLIRLFPNENFLILMGVAMAIFGSVFALLKTDLRQILSYLLITSLGFMLTSLGTGTIEAVNAILVYILNHILYNTLLFMCVASIYTYKKSQDIKSLHGLIKTMPLTSIGLTLGFLAISGLPVFNGYIGKALIFESLKHIPLAYYFLKFSSLLVSLTSVRLLYSLIFIKTKETPFEVKNHHIATILFLSSVVVISGIFPQTFSFSLLLTPDFAKIFTLRPLTETILIFILAALVYIIGIHKVKMRIHLLHDIDHLYEVILHEIVLFFKDPLPILSRWSNLVLYLKHSSLSKIKKDSADDNLRLSKKHFEAAKAKGDFVESRFPKMDIMSLGASLFLTALVVMIFLLFLYFIV